MHNLQVDIERGEIVQVDANGKHEKALRPQEPPPLPPPREKTNHISVKSSPHAK